MKALYKIFLWPAVIAVGCLCACKQDPSLYGNDENVPEVLTIAASPESITLDPEALTDEPLLIITWNEAAPRGPYDEIEYVFKMDLSDNAFQTTQTAYREEIPAGVFSKTITCRQLYNLLIEKWRVALGSTVGVDIRIIATVYGPKFVRPEVSTTRVDVNIFKPAAKPLYIMGTAVPDGGSNTDYTAKKIMMQETLPGQEYTFNGTLAGGSFIFVTAETDPATLLPAYVKGADDTLIVWQTTGTPQPKFTVATTGEYTITVRTDRLTAKINRKVIINGVEWTPTNVDERGKFAATPNNPGKYYQFLGMVGYSATDEWPGVNGASTPIDVRWFQHPCPEGYIMLDEWAAEGVDMITALSFFPRMYRAAGTAGNTINGVFIGPDSPTATINNPGDAIFIPFAGYRHPQTGTLTEYGEKAYIHTGNPYYGISSQIIVIDATTTVSWSRQQSNPGNWGMGASVRCIKKL
jgi:hypothetical protein